MVRRNLTRVELAHVLIVGLAVGCGKVIGADFDGRKPLPDATGASAGSDGGGSGPQAGTTTASGGTGGAAGAILDAGGRGGSEASGGTTNGGNGGSDTGGAATGGAGGETAGGPAQGGAPTGGGTPGGAPAGGVATGGAATGGVATGGVATGGVDGGAPTGGVATGGAPTGGVSAGGACNEEATGDANLVVVNEVLVGGGTDYVELYNTGTAIADLSGYGVADEDGGAPKFSEAMRFPDCTLIGPGEYLVVLAQQSSVGGPYLCSGVPCFYATWGLKSDGETAYFLSPINAIVDQGGVPGPSDGGPVDGQSWSRIPNGTGPFRLGLPTRGFANVPVDDPTGTSGGAGGVGGT